MARIEWVATGRNKWYGVVGARAFEIRRAVLGYRLYSSTGTGKWSAVGNFATVEAAQHAASGRANKT